MRFQDWPIRLASVIKRHDTPFLWGSSDCMQLCMDAVEEMTGEHPWPDTKPINGVARYLDRHGARAMLKSHGFDNITEAWASRYPLVAISRAQRGDIGIVAMVDGVTASAVCEGVYFAGKGPSDQRLIRVPRSAVVQAYRIS